MFDAGVASEKHLYYPPIPRFRLQVKLNSGKQTGFGKAPQKKRVKRADGHRTPLDRIGKRLYDRG